MIAEGKSSRVCRALLAFLGAALLLTAKAQTQEPRAQNAPVVAPRVMPFSQQQIAELEARLQANPDDLEVRTQLMLQYGALAHRNEFLEQLIWIVQNHPESAFAVSGPPTTPQEDEQLKAAWEQAAASHMNSPDVLFNAGTFFERSDPEHALQLFESAQQQDSSKNSGRYVRQIARIYAAAEMSGAAAAASVRTFPALTTATAEALRAQLQVSSDPALLSETGAAILQLSTLPIGERREAAFPLMQRAIDLDPSNPRWKAALESAKAAQSGQLSTPAGAVQVGNRVAEANLLNKVDPVYPALAQAARVQGDVEFTVVIGADGHVESLRLVRGHPLLVNAAKDALLQWTYRPTLLNGQPVSVVTDVVVPFRLPISQ